MHFLLMDGYGDYSAGSAQHAWVLADLAAVDRSSTPWLVVAFHQPYYNSNTAHAGEGAALAGIYEAPFFAAGVDLCFSGHVHGAWEWAAALPAPGTGTPLPAPRAPHAAYERSFRTYLNESNAAAPYYITIGDGGCAWARRGGAPALLPTPHHRPAPRRNREGLAATWSSPQPAWSAFRQASYGHGELEVPNATHMHWTWHQNPDVSVCAVPMSSVERSRLTTRDCSLQLEPVIADEFWIVKGQSASGTPATASPRFRSTSA